jgi:hypothetical protein
MDTYKINLIRSKAQDLMELSNLLTFIELPVNDLKTIMEMKGNDWISYGSLIEYECFDNRIVDDIPNDTSKGSNYLSKDMFNRLNKSKLLTFPLYIAMSSIQKKK